MAFCLKAQTIYAFANGATATKTSYPVYVVDSTVLDPALCPGSVMLSGTEYQNFLTMLTSFTWDSSLFEATWQGGLIIFATGLGIGLIISLVRKLRV